MILSREQLLAQRLPFERVKVPWLEDQEIIVRALPMDVATRFENVEHKWAFVFVNTVIDENGKRLFSDADIPLIIDTVEPSLLDLVFAVANRLTAIPEARREAIKKNSSPSVIEGSGEPPSP